MMRQEYLVSPACEQGCPDCLRSCAVARIRVMAWGELLQKYMRERDAEGIEEAQRAITRFSQEVRKPKVARRVPKLRLIQGGKA